MNQKQQELYQHLKRKIAHMILEHDKLIVLETKNELHIKAVKKGL
jgi:hypothetical protein